MAETANPRVLHIITGLRTGGAEMMLFKLLRSKRNSIESCVICLMERGPIAGRIESLGVPVHCLDLAQGALPGLGTVVRLLRLSREFRPSTIQGWMYHGNLAAWLAAKALSVKARLYWNIRQTLYDRRLEGRLTRWMIGLGARLSSSPDKIIYNSRLSAEQHEAAGFFASNRMLIPNGFDLAVFRPDLEARRSVRHEFGLPDSTILIGHLARFHPMKGHGHLLAAARSVVSRFPNTRFLLAGHRITGENAELVSQIEMNGLRGKIILAGERRDMPRLTAALDLLVSSSVWGEGFPNVVGEAMASGVPCVVTDIGDSAWIVGECGRIAPPGDASRLAAEMCAILTLEPVSRQQLGLAARERISELFAIDRVGQMYADLYGEPTSTTQ